MRVQFEPVRESEGECAWEACEPYNAEAWRVTKIDSTGDVRSWAFKTRKRAAIACRDLAEGKIQPLGLSDLASTGTRCAYLP